MATFFVVAKGESIASSHIFSSKPNERPYLVRENDDNVLLPCSFAVHAPSAMWVAFVNEKPQLISLGAENRQPDTYDLDSASCPGCYNLRIKKIRFDLHNGRFYCQLNDSMSAMAHVIVLVKPGFPSLSGVAPTLREGFESRLECESMGGNPAPSIRWSFSNGSDVTHLARIQESHDPRRPSLSVLRWSLSAEDHAATVTCAVRNEAMHADEAEMRVDTVPLEVLFSPRVTIGPSSPFSVIVNDSATLQCLARANPAVARFAWRFNDRPLNNPSPNLTIYSVTKAMAGNYTCMAENGEKTGQSSAYLNVLYPPEISLSSEHRSAVGRRVTLTCSVDANPAPATITWTSPNGRASDGAVFELDAVTLADQGSYTCLAKSVMRPSNGDAIVRTAQRGTILVVDHPPGKGIVSLSPDPPLVGFAVELKCKADVTGSPSAQFFWRRPSDTDFGATPSDTLTLTSARLTDSGSYSCLPFNIVGRGQAGSINLTVYEPAKIEKSLPVEDNREENETSYILNCSARGYPAPKIVWFHESDPIPLDDDRFEIRAETTNSFCGLGDTCPQQVHSFIKWRDVIRWSDKGHWHCVASNKAGQPARSTSILNIKHRPYITNDPGRPFAAGRFGAPLELRCRASARPPPTFQWLAAGGGRLVPAAVVGQPAVNVAATTGTLVRGDGDLYESVLRIATLDVNTMGDYECKATNRYGSGAMIFTVQAESKPWSPTDFKSTKQSHRWISLSWTPGFNGGGEQTFLVEMDFPGNNAQPQRTFSIAESGALLQRQTRHTLIETAKPLVLNVTNDISPSSEYRFRIKAKNSVGETEWSSFLSVWSEDAPLNMALTKLIHAVFSPATSTIEYSPSNIDPQLYCLMVYTRDQPGEKYVTYSCYDPSTGKIENFPTPMSGIKLRFCYRLTLECGESFEIPVTGLGRAFFSWEVIVGLIVSLFIISALITAGCMFCGCCRRFTANKLKKNNSAKIGMPKIHGLRPKTISGPYLTEKTPGPVGGLGTLDKNTASSKDSGVYTTNGSLANYNHLDAAAFVSDQPDARRPTSMSNGARRPSYGSESQNWDASYNWDPQMANGNAYQHYNHNQKLHSSMNGLNGNGPRRQRLSSSDNDDPFVDGVDLNPDPRFSDPANQSQFSTPTQRRIIREIIV